MAEGINIAKLAKYKLTNKKEQLVNNGVLKIPKGILRIKYREYHKKLITNLYLPKSLKIIENSAFNENEIKELKIPSSIRKIGFGAFSNNKIEHLEIENGVKHIGEYAFAGNQIKEITIPTSISKLENNVFAKNQIQEVIIPDNIETIGRSAFENNELNRVFISKKTKKIESLAFANNQLSSIELPDFIKELGNYAFMRNKIEAFTFPTSIKSISDGLFMGNQLTSVIIPSQVTSIGESAFAFNKLKELEIPNNVSSIGESTFVSNEISHLQLSNQLHLIPKRAFYGNKLTELAIPSSVVSIDNHAFAFNKIQDLKLNEGTVIIGNGAFSNNIIQMLELPNSVVAIDEKAFSQNKIKSLHLSSNIRAVGNSAFAYNKLESLEIEEGIIQINNGTFYSNQLTNIIIPNSVKIIGTNAFANNNLEKVTLPNNIEDIRKDAFAQNPNLKKVIYRDKEIFLQHGIKDIRFDKERLIILSNNFAELKVFNREGAELRLNDQELKEVTDLFDNKDEIELAMRRVLEWEKVYTSKAGVVDHDTLKRLGPEIITTLEPNRENANQIKQGLKIYNEIKENASFHYEETRDLFKMCYVLGLFDGQKEYSTYINEYIKYLLNRKKMTESRIHAIFDTFQIENGYNRQVSHLLMKALDNIYFLNNYTYISRLYNEYGLIKTFIDKAYKRDLRDLGPRIRILEANNELNDDEQGELSQLREESERKKRSIEKIGLDEVIFYIENNLFKFRKGNEELSSVAYYLKGMSQKDFDAVQDIYEQSKGVPKALIQTKDQDTSNYTYQWSPSDNPVNIVLAYIVNCCARKNGAGEDIMRQSMINPLVQNLIIRDPNQNIIAKSTAYYNQEEGYILFNNVEAATSFVQSASQEQKEKAIEAVKRAVADQVKALKEQGILLNEVRMGMLRNDLFTADHLKVEKNHLLSNYPYKSYNGDANSSAHGQGILYAMTKDEEMISTYSR